MAASPTREIAEPVERSRCIAVAFSGGRDSTALLHASLAEATPLGIGVVALHVHHGLSEQADAWLAHCKAQCTRWSRRHPTLRFEARRLTTRPGPGESVEAWARQARYRALQEMAVARGASLVLLAHHRRDQAETMLLQALRGAGIAGLSAMPERALRNGIEWRRPWLRRPREAIEAYLRRHRLAYVDDDSNTDPRFARNRLRLCVWPALASAFDHAEVALAASADWAQQAASALDELALMDLNRVASESAGLDVAAWLTLSPARRSNALRAWLRRQHGRGASATLVDRLMSELPTAGSARWPFAAAELRLYRGHLTCREPTLLLPRRATEPAREQLLSVRRVGAHALPGWGGRLEVARVAEGGVPLVMLAATQLRGREGSERFQAGAGRPPRSLKKQYQSVGVAAWERDGPLVYSGGGQLVFVPGLGLDARVVGVVGQAMVALAWIADRDPR